MAENRKDESPNGQATGSSGSDRVESTLEGWGRRAGRFVAVAVARAREEAEDMWAEAQSIRRGNKNKK